MPTEQEAKRVETFPGFESDQLVYWKTEGVWYLNLPRCGLANLANHSVVEHEDGTISATPSILVHGHHEGVPAKRHGYITRGIWREC